MDSNPISMLERPQTVRRGTLRKYTSPTRTVGAGKCFSPAAGVEKLCRIFQIDTTSFLTGCTQMTARVDGRPFHGGAVREPQRPSSHPAREPLLDLLQQPNVAVGIAERGIRGVGTVLGIRTRGARLSTCDKPAAEAAARVV